MKSEKIAIAHHSSLISSQIHNHSSQTPAEYPRNLKEHVIRPIFALGNV